jgi:hypothetical protein
VNKDEAQKFLDDFKSKLSVYNIVYRDERNKNQQALADLEILPYQRTEYIKSLSVENYCSGPHKNKLYPNHPDYWEFGIIIKGIEIYIKIEMGLPKNSVICISFHVAERKLSFPFIKRS